MAETNPKSSPTPKPQPQKVEQPVPGPAEEARKENVMEDTHFFHSVQFSDEKRETLDEKEIETSKVEMEQKLSELLTSINEETLQLSEFLMEESNLVNELCLSLKQILKQLKISFNLKVKHIPFHTSVKKVILNEEGHLIVVHEKDEVSSAFLADYSPEIVMAVLWDVLPELAKVMTLYRKKISTRVNFFGKVKKELKGIVKAMGGSTDEEVETQAEPVLDAAKEALQSQT